MKIGRKKMIYILKTTVSESFFNCRSSLLKLVIFVIYLERFVKIVSLTLDGNLSTK